MSGQERKIRRVYAPFHALLSVDGQSAYVRAPDLEPGDVLEVDNVPYVVLGRLHSRAKIDKTKIVSNYLYQGKDEKLFRKVMTQYAWYPKRKELFSVADFEPAVIRFTVLEKSRELEYSDVYLIEGGPTQDYWDIDLLIRKNDDKPQYVLEPGKTYVAYGTFRWSGFGTLRFNAVTVIPYEE